MRTLMWRNLLCQYLTQIGVSRSPVRGLGMAYSATEIQIGGLIINISTELSYPDAMDDLCNRAIALFKESIEIMKANDIDVTVMNLNTVLPEDFEE